MARKVILCLLALLTPASGYAQDLDPLASDDAATDPLLMHIPSVYGASKYEQKVTDAPSAVSVVTAAEIATYGYDTLGELLASLIGVYMTNDLNYTYLGVRGFGRPGDYNARVQLLVDGHRMNDPIYGAVSVGNDAVVSVHDIERIEVIRGPSSSLYGDNALFAVINVVTRRGRDLQGAEVTVSGDSLRGLRGRVAWGRRFGDGFELSVTAGAWNRFAREHYFPELDAPETGNGRVTGADAERAFDGSVRLGNGAFSLLASGSWRRKGVPTAPFGSVFGTDQTVTHDVRGFFEARYDETMASGLRVLARAYYDHVDYRGDYLYDYAEPDDLRPSLVVNRDESFGDSVGAEVTLSDEVLPWLRLVGGAHFQQDLRLHQTNYDEEVYFVSDDLTTSLAMYLQADVKLGSYVSLSAGGRLDWYDELGLAGSPRAALVFKPFTGAALKLIYGEAFRAPNAYERLYHDGELTTKPAGSLAPERMRMYELVWEQQIDETFRAVVDGYYYSVDDLISLQSDPADGLLVFDNVDEVRALGLEATLEWRLPETLEGRVSYAVQRAWDLDTGERLTNSPEHSVKLNVAVPVVGRHLRVGLEAQYMSSRRTIHGTSAEPVGLVNLTLTSADLLPGLEISARVTNLLDRQYGDPGSEEHVQRTIPQDGVAFRGRVSWRF